jgi:hypothetical protein
MLTPYSIAHLLMDFACAVLLLSRLFKNDDWLIYRFFIIFVPSLCKCQSDC